MEVIAFIDDCGHTVVVDVTGPRQALKIAAQILQETIDDGLLPYNKGDKEGAEKLARCLVGTANTLLGTDASEEMMTNHESSVWEFLDGCDIGIGTRDGFSSIDVRTDWPKGCIQN